MFKSFRLIALLEGISYLLLLFVAVPLKYLGDNDLLVKSLGMPHGVLFVVYVILAFVLKGDRNWTGKNLGKTLIASVLPFGTFVADKKYF